MSVMRQGTQDYTINDPNIANEFDPTEVYAAGTYVNYQGDLYRLTANHAANTTWTNTSKTKVKIGDEIKGIKGDISDLPTIRSNISQNAEDIDQIESDISDLPTIRSNVSQNAEDIDDIENDIGGINSKFDKISGNTNNLWKNPIFTGNGVTLTQNKDGSLHVQGTPETESLFVGINYDGPLDSGNYVISCRKKGTLTGAGRAYVCTRNEANTGTQFLQMVPGIDYAEIKLTSFAPYRCEVILFSDTTYNCDLYVQLEKGISSTDYVPETTAIDYMARNMVTNMQDGIKGENVLLANAQNYVDVLVIDEKSTVEKWGLGAGVLEHNGKTVHYSVSSAANGGFYTERFMSDSFVLQITNLAFDLAITTGTVRVWLYGTNKSGGDYANVIAYPTEGHNDISIDFAYYDVYSTLDISKPIRFLITNGGTEVSDFTVSNLEFKSLVTSQKYITQYSDEKLFNILDSVMGLIPTIPEQVYIKSPDGNKWLIRVSNTGELSAVKIVPNKSVFIGNSLLMGWSTFGMTASDNEHDYYYHVTHRIATLDNTATYNHISNGNLEHSTNSTDFNAAWNTIKPYLTSDLDLICIQLGDNVNTSAKEAQFKGIGGSFDTMVTWIHENCPNSRLIWVGTWYPSIHDWLSAACEARGVEFVDILPLSTSANKAVLGDVVTRTEDREQTLTGSYTISGSSLLLTVSIYGITYNITIPSYTRVEDNGNGTFTMVAPYTVVDSTGVQSHPGDSGMLEIAKAILKQIGID